MLQLADGFGFDLPHALPGDFENPAHFLQRVGIAVAQAVPQADDLALAMGERFEQTFDFFTQQLIRRRLERALRSTVFDELPKTTIFAFADRSVKAYGLSSDA